jgi:hypothetical protein
VAHQIATTDNQGILPVFNSEIATLLAVIFCYPSKITMNMMRWMAICLLICATAWASDSPKGTVPRAAPDRYDAHAEQNDVALGATRLTPKLARKVFTTDVNRCCVVVEVALYPQKDGRIEVSLNDFTLNVAGQDIGAKPSSAKVAALHSSQDRDRLRPTLIVAMEQELSEKGLPQGSTSTPVSGYLYFSLPENKNAKYQLEYTLKGNKLTLALN